MSPTALIVQEQCLHKMPRSKRGCNQAMHIVSAFCGLQAMYLAADCFGSMGTTACHVLQVLHLAQGCISNKDMLQALDSCNKATTTGEMLPALRQITFKLTSGNAGTMASPCEICPGQRKTWPFNSSVLTLTYYCIQSAVIKSQLHCPYYHCCCCYHHRHPDNHCRCCHYR